MSAARPELHEPQEAYDGPAVLVVAGTAGTAGRPSSTPSA